MPADALATLPGVIGGRWPDFIGSRTRREAVNTLAEGEEKPQILRPGLLLTVGVLVARRLSGGEAHFTITFS